MSGTIIILDGNIGVGKTHLSKSLKRSHLSNLELYEEPVSQSLLALFYTNPKAYGFALQLHKLTIRRSQLQLAQLDTVHNRLPPVRYFVWDRSIFGDYAFALWNHLLGNITRAEFDVYEDLFGGSLLPGKLQEQQTSLIDNILGSLMANKVERHFFLFDSPEYCEQRVKLQRGHSAESNIPLAYFVGIEDVHFYLLLFLLQYTARKLPLSVVTFNQYKNVDSVDQLLQQPVANLQVTSDYQLLVDINKPTSYIYLNTLSKLQTFNDSTTASLASTVVISVAEEMLVRPDVSHCDIHPNARVVTFYSTAFKQTVIKALSEGKLVILENTKL